MQKSRRKGINSTVKAPSLRQSTNAQGEVGEGDFITNININNVININNKKTVGAKTTD
jgi:hypothetical protein